MKTLKLALKGLVSGGTPLWVVFSAPGSRANFHLQKMRRELVVHGLNEIRIVCVSRTEIKFDDKNVSMVVDADGSLYEDVKNSLKLQNNSLMQVKKLLRRILGIKFAKQSRPLHLLVAEDGIVERAYQGAHFADHIPLQQVEKFFESRRLGWWRTEGI